MTKNTFTLTLAFVVALQLVCSVAEAQVFYIGDNAAAGQAVTDLGNPDGANSGNMTYAYVTDGYTNSSGDSQLLEISEVNFFSDSTSADLTPFVATYNGGSLALASSFSVVSVGEAINVASTGVINENFVAATGSSDIIELADGETLIAGFHQTAGVVGFSGAGDPDYLAQGNEIPVGALPDNLVSNADWSTLTRTYSFNIGVQEATVPEPASIALWSLLGLLGVGYVWMRRRK